jgi:hypothetical protein
VRHYRRFVEVSGGVEAGNSGVPRRAAGAAGTHTSRRVPSPVPARACICWHFVWHAARESSRGSDGYIFVARARVVWRDFVTFRPEPLLRVPFFLRRIADATVLDADFPYFAMTPSR